MQNATHFLLTSGAHVPITNRMRNNNNNMPSTTTSHRPTALSSLLSAGGTQSAVIYAANASTYMLTNSSQTRSIDDYGFVDVDDESFGHIETVMHLITLLTSSTSLVMLCFSIITYSLFSDMRDLAGLIMLNASVALFFCQLLLLVGIDRVVEHQLPLCNAIAMLMHLFWLASLCWFVIGIYDLAQDFRTRLAPSVPGSTLRDTLVAYCVAGWGIPSGIVCMCSLLHSIGPAMVFDDDDDEHRKKFGLAFSYLHQLRTRCWFPDKHGVVFGLLLPFASALPVVVLCMRQTWHNIELTSRLSAKAGVVKRWKKPDAIMFELYIKLFCLSGFVWLLCFMAGVGIFDDDVGNRDRTVRSLVSPSNGSAPPTSNYPVLFWTVNVAHNTFWYAFEIALAMFGTCVSLLFTCNGAVFKAYASGRSKRSRRHSSIISGAGASQASSTNNTFSSFTAATGGATAAAISLATIHESWSGERLMEAAIDSAADYADLSVGATEIV